MDSFYDSGHHPLYELLAAGPGQGESAGFEAFDAVDRIAFVVAAFTASAVWQMAVVLAGAALGRLLTGYRGRLVTGVVAGTLIAALAVRTFIG